MIYNGDTNGQDIITLVNDYCSTTNLVFPLAEKTRAINVASSRIWSEIFDSYAGWQYDDKNQVNLPEDIQTLTTGVSDYTIPPLSLTVIGVDIRVSGAATNNWTKIYPATKEEIRQYGLSDLGFSQNNGVAFRYILIKDKIRLIPAPNYTQTLSLRVSFDRGSIAFLPTDTTKEPGFASEFHYGLAIGASLEWARRNATSNTQNLETMYADFVVKLKKYYSQRFKDNFPIKISFNDDTQEYI